MRDFKDFPGITSLRMPASKCKDIARHYRNLANTYEPSVPKLVDSSVPRDFHPKRWTFSYMPNTAVKTHKNHKDVSYALVAAGREIARLVFPTVYANPFFPSGNGNRPALAAIAASNPEQIKSDVGTRFPMKAQPSINVLVDSLAKEFDPARFEVWYFTADFDSTVA